MKKEVSEKSERFLDLYFKDYEDVCKWVRQTEPEQFALAPNVRKKDQKSYPIVVSVRRKEEVKVA